jgi:hypothetical protein
MTPDHRSFRAKGAEIGSYGAAFVYQRPFEKDFSTGPRVINEVVLGTWVNKRKKGRSLGTFDPSSPLR